MAAQKAAVVTPRWVNFQPTKWVSFTPSLTVSRASSDFDLSLATRRHALSKWSLSCVIVAPMIAAPGRTACAAWVTLAYQSSICHRRATNPWARPTAASGLSSTVRSTTSQEVRAELEGRGTQFRSHSDTEVIIEGYRVWGDAVIDRLRGMFAFTQ
jgi:Glutamine amidotransferase domain